MNGNFSRLNKQGDDLKVEGWLTWASNDKSAELRITVTQGTISATSAPFTVKKNDLTWDTTLNSVVFAKGLAQGQAGATVTFEDGSKAPVPGWTSNPLMVE